MESERFDRIARTWAATSRRRVLAGLASTLGASLPMALGATVADAKKKKRKCRNCCRADGTLCRKKTKACKPANCCPAGQVRCTGQCGLPNLARGCLFTSVKCCSNRCVADACFPCPGKPCAADSDCCDGLPCIATASAGLTCGGCLSGNIGTCQSSDDCCSAECNNGTCLSRLGEQCATRLDCRGLPGWAPDCVRGTCICPRECCADTDCTSPKVCRSGACTCPTPDECCLDTDCAPAEQCVNGICKLRPPG